MKVNRFNLETPGLGGTFPNLISATSLTGRLSRPMDGVYCGVFALFVLMPLGVWIFRFGWNFPPVSPPIPNAMFMAIGTILVFASIMAIFAPEE